MSGRIWTDDLHQAARGHSRALDETETCEWYICVGSSDRTGNDVHVESTSPGQPTIAICEPFVPRVTKDEPPCISWRRARFIAHARTALPAALDEIERLNEVCASNEHVNAGLAKTITELERRLAARKKA